MTVGWQERMVTVVVVLNVLVSVAQAPALTARALTARLVLGQLRLIR